MFVTQDIAEDTYTSFLSYALETSDAFMLVIKYCDATIFSYRRHIENVKKISPSCQLDEQAHQRLKNMEKQSKENKKIFYDVCLPQMKTIQSSLIKHRNDPVWPSTIAAPKKAKDYDICVYPATHNLTEFLLKPGSYLSWRYPRYPEDLSFFRNNRCWAYASSHEGYIVIDPDSEEEWRHLQSMGIQFDEDRFVYTPEEQRFYESY